MPIQKVMPAVSRLFVGLVFTVFGLNFFLHFLPTPPPPPRAATFMAGMASGGYLLELVHAVEVVAGLLLLANRFVPLALTVLAPVIVNIVAFHLMLAPQGIPLAVVILALEFYLAWTYRRAFAPMLNASTRPDSAAAVHVRPADDRRNAA